MEVTVYSFAVYAVSMCLLPHVAHGKADGAPDSTCQTMQPGHGSAQTSQSPYTIEIEGSPTAYQAGQVFTIKIKGGNFQGILMQARTESRSNLPQVGKFTSVPSNTKKKGCTIPDDSVTHSNTQNKDENSVFTWEAPSSDEGNIYFIATVAQAQYTYWMNIQTEALPFDSGETPTPAPTEGPTPAPTEEASDGPTPAPSDDTTATNTEEEVTTVSSAMSLFYYSIAATVVSLSIGVMTYQVYGYRHL